MIIDIWKVKIAEGYERTFEKLCKERNLPIKPYPKSAKGYYRVKGLDYALLDIGLFIRSLEKLPIAIVE